jgi:SAM-dependent methyltransferase
MRPAAVRGAQRWNELSARFRYKATDWAAGYLPAFERDLGLSLARSPQNAQRRILDHGCGKGGVSRFLAGSLGVGEVHGVDVSGNMVTQAMAISNREAGPQNLSYEVLDQPDELPYPSEYFSGIASFFVLPTIADAEEQRQVARELLRVLAPEGRLVVLINNPASYGERFATVQAGLTTEFPSPGARLPLQLFALGADRPFLDDYYVHWPVDHYVELLSAVGFTSVTTARRRFEARYETWMERLGVGCSALQREREIAPLVSIIASR